MSDNRFNVFKRKGLHFVHINAGSMFHKLSELRYFASVHKPAGISITETWTNKSHTDASINIDGYNLVRRDRETHAGGVCMYIRNDLAFNPRPDLQNEI